jgi:hypothetical protein
MTHTATWKTLERTAARKLGGVRIVRGENYSQSLLDVEHPWLAIDCKWRSTLATVKWFKKLVKDNDKIYGKNKKIPILVIKEKGMRGELVVIDIEDFIMLVNANEYKIEPKENEDDEEE